MSECRHGWEPNSVNGFCSLCEVDQLRQQLAAEQAKSAEMNDLAREHFTAAVEQQERAEEAEATIAAMRSALENLLQKIEDGDDCFEDVDGMNGFLGKTIPPSCMEIFEAEQALSNTANTENADRVKKLEEIVRKVEWVDSQKRYCEHSDGYAWFAVCPICGEREIDGHSDGCSIKAVLGEAKA